MAELSKAKIISIDLPRRLSVSQATKQIRSIRNAANRAYISDALLQGRFLYLWRCFRGTGMTIFV